MVLPWAHSVWSMCDGCISEVLRLELLMQHCHCEHNITIWHDGQFSMKASLLILRSIVLCKKWPPTQKTAMEQPSESETSDFRLELEQTTTCSNNLLTWVPKWKARSLLMHTCCSCWQCVQCVTSITWNQHRNSLYLGSTGTVTAVCTPYQHGHVEGCG